MTTQAPLIMIVDDDQDFLEMTSNLLEGGGYRIKCCRGTAEALASMRRDRPGLVITDLMMTNMDEGFSLARRIKCELGGTPVVIVTAIGRRLGFDFRPHSPADLEAMGVEAFFEKPVAPHLLLGKVRELLGANPEEASQ